MHKRLETGKRPSNRTRDVTNGGGWGSGDPLNLKRAAEEIEDAQQMGKFLGHNHYARLTLILSGG